MSVKEQIDTIINKVKQRNAGENLFLQAVEEVTESLIPFLEKNPKYVNVLESLFEPERVIMFRVPWVDDKGNHCINRGFRVQFSSTLGPYKGGLRFRDNVDLSTIKFLGFEQIFKNSLTTLPLGAGKGGSDFDPKGKSDNEVMRFCQSFMTELHRHIGGNTDVPAGDIGVGAREIGFLFGQYKRLNHGTFEGVLTGKNPRWGGSYIRPEATGYGLVYYAVNALEGMGDTLKGKRVLVSGSGNVAQYCVEKTLHEGGIPITMSDSAGYIVAENGITEEILQEVMDLKNERRGRLSELDGKFGLKYVAGKKPWGEKADVAFPCATQNEIDTEDAEELVQNGVKAVAEGANMPSSNEAINVFEKHNVLFCPAKAANAGGVAVSGLEMAQNSQRLQWTREQVDERLQKIMKDIYDNCSHYAEVVGQKHNLKVGANIAGFVKVAQSMLEQGSV